MRIHPPQLVDVVADDRAWKAREARARRKAYRQELRLEKSRCRTPSAVDFGCYWLTDIWSRALMLGGQFGVSLDAVEDFLSQED